MADLATYIRDEAQAALPQLIAVRRELHAHPELSFAEEATAARIVSELERIGVPCTAGWAGHGVVALLQGRASGRVLALRADMDALPVAEAGTHDYRSRNEGVMHACGHDAHMAILLGAARLLHGCRDQWEGTVKLIFQPGEEKLPGGASLMIKAGVLEDPVPEAIFGLHVHPELPAGQVGFRPGMFMAAADELYLTIEGRGGHAAQPHLTVDPIVAAASVIQQVQLIVSRFTSPLLPVVLSFGKINSDGGATNIIPDRVFLEGTLRTFDEATRRQVHDQLEALVEQTCAALGARAHLEIRKGYPALYNHPALTQQARSQAVDYLGAAQVHDLEMRMGAEDFAYYSQEMPACFWRLGTGRPGQPPGPGLHHPQFDIDEQALATGAGLTAWLAIRYLAS